MTNNCCEKCLAAKPGKHYATIQWLCINPSCPCHIQPCQGLKEEFISRVGRSLFTQESIADWWLNKIRMVIEDIPDGNQVSGQTNRKHLKTKYLKE